MEKKTIGQFIAVLRKSNGLTQKDLAEELNVSDKTISHWERDESAPDLSLIPVIADLFGVTTDELLRGERRPTVGKAAEAAEAAAGSASVSGDGSPEETPHKPDRRTDRQLKVLLDRIKLKFRTHSLIACCIGGLGLLTALLFNFAVPYAKLAFFLALILYAAGAVVEIIALMNTRVSLDAEEFEGDRLDACKRSVTRIACTTFSILGGLLLFTLPLVLFKSNYLRTRLSSYSWFPEGARFVLIAVLVWAVVFLILRSRSWIKYLQNDRFLKLKCVCALFTLLALLLTFGLQCALNFFIDLPLRFAPRADLVAENPVDALIKLAEEDDHGRWEDQEILAADGTVLRTFTKKNGCLYDWSCEWDEDGNAVVTIVMSAQLIVGEKRTNRFNVAYCALYVMEIVAGFVVYFKVKEKRSATAR